MKMNQIPFGTTDWSAVTRTEHPGTTGKAFWRTQQFGDVRVRMVEYSAGYVSDHWCSKGHILLCMEGELHTTLDKLEGSGLFSFRTSGWVPAGTGAVSPASTIASRIDCPAPFEPRGTIGCAASPSNVTWPKVQRSSGS